MEEDAEILYDALKTPVIGMTFDSEKEAHDFYNDYGRRVGFSIRVQYSHTSKSTGKLTSITYVCAKEGFRKVDKKRGHLVTNPREETRVGCGALFGVRFDKKLQKYVVNKFEEKHTHELVARTLAHMLPSQRAVTAAQATEIELAADSGIALRSSYELLSRQSGGKEGVGFLKIDQKNYLRTRRQRMMAFGEVGCISNYFSEKRRENPSFFHDSQLDIEEQVTNVFWADAHMIADYHNFGAGDVVTFDTTYKINRENRPFALFDGFNNHRQTVVFGAALMYDETADSFTWLFRTFMKAMSDKHPKTIFTDQDDAMAKAIPIVMPNTYHRLCKWHMMQNAFKHLNTIFRNSDSVTNVLAPFFDDYEDDDEFLLMWDVLLEDYSLHDNSWLRSILNLRHKWGRPYVKWHWSAGMKSTQLSESLNATLKQYLRADYNLVQFFTHFDTAIDDIHYNELHSQFSLSYKLPMVKLKSIRMLVQAGEIFTKAIFEEFQDEYESSLQLHVKKPYEEDGCCIIYTVASPLQPNPRRVMKAGDDILYCDCRLFEMRGVVCRHVIKVLKDVLCFLELPEHYILKRWTKGARAETVMDSNGREIDVDPKLARNTRFKELCAFFIRIAGRASETEITTDVLRKCGREASKTIEDLLHSLITDQNNQSKEANNEDTGGNVAEAGVPQAKGFKKKPPKGSRGNRRIKGCLEKTKNPKRRKNMPIEESGPSLPNDIPSQDYTFVPNYRSSQVTDMTKISVPPPFSHGSWTQNCHISGHDNI